jgi:SHS2 domain-containing protein
LIEICAIGQPDPGSGSRVSRIGVAGGGLARAVLEEVVFALDTSELVPVSVHLQRAGGDEVKLRLGLADRESVQFTGAAPKAIVMLDSGSRHPDDLVRCRFIVDV